MSSNGWESTRTSDLGGDLAKQASITLDENLKALWRMFVAPDASGQAAEQSADGIQPAIQGEDSDDNSSTPAEKE